MCAMATDLKSKAKSRSSTGTITQGRPYHEINALFIDFSAQQFHDFHPPPSNHAIHWNFSSLIFVIFLLKDRACPLDGRFESMPSKKIKKPSLFRFICIDLFKRFPILTALWFLSTPDGPFSLATGAPFPPSWI
jgi:hypothetical protein